jgi:hypothetical protein
MGRAVHVRLRGNARGLLRAYVTRRAAPVRLFALSTARLAFRYARAHKHDGLGSIAIRCVRCAPLSYDGSAQYAGPMPSEPVADGKVLRLADLQAKDMDARDRPPDVAPF